MRYGLVMIAVCACSKDYDGKPYIDVSMFDQAEKQAQCTHDTRCGLFPDSATCMATTVESGIHLDEAAVADVYSGRTHYDGELAAACIAALSLSSCDVTALDNRFPSPSCSAMLVGTGSANAPCFEPAECRSGNCQSTGTDCIEGQNGSVMCCVGACLGDAPPVTDIPLGSDCFSGQCIAGTFCDGETFDCAPDKAAGEACGTDLECGDGLVCLPQGSGTFCAALPSSGSACPLGRCRNDNEYCDAETTTCAVFGLPGDSCATQLCSYAFECDPSTTTCAQGAHVGQTCIAQECFDAGTYCDPAQTCTPYLADGAMCDETTQCAGSCDPTTSKCVAQPCGSAM
jgi:hypothetical protein